MPECFRNLPSLATEERSRRPSGCRHNRFLLYQKTGATSIISAVPYVEEEANGTFRQVGLAGMLAGINGTGPYHGVFHAKFSIERRGTGRVGFVRDRCDVRI